MAAPEFGQITERHERVAIVASGPSARGFEAPPGVTVIAVNGAIEWVDRADYWFTLDPGARNRVRMLGQRPEVTYLAAVPETFGTPEACYPGMRQPAPEGVRYLRRIAGPGILGSMPRLSRDPARIHTGNSGYGALGVAYLFRPKRIGLFGIDASRAHRVEGGRPSRLDHLPALFASARPQLVAAGIKVIDASPHGHLRCFQKMTAEAALEWLTA